MVLETQLKLIEQLVGDASFYCERKKDIPMWVHTPS
jgi:hypothetical protein